MKNPSPHVRHCLLYVIMRSAIIFAILAIALAHPPRLAEVAREVNSLHTTWIANEAIPTRDYSKFIGALRGGYELPVKSISSQEARNHLLMLQ